MKVVCCGCGLHLRDVASKVFSDDVVSHGMCKKCAHHFLAQVGMPLPEYLEGLSEPVVIVNKEGRINAANHQALSLLEKAPDQIQDQLTGDVFECENAMLPGGCGKTVHCSGCVIRNTITDTITTGTPHRGVRALLKQADGKETKAIDIYISTEKKGDIVFLQVDEMKPSVA